MSKVILSAFGDEVSSDLREQMDVLESCSIKHIELRGVWGKNVLSFTDDEVDQIHTQMRERGFRISSIGSPIGKISVLDDWNKHLADYKRILDIAKAFGTRYVRIFSFYIPEDRAPQQFRDVVLERMSQFAQLAEDEDIVAVHENESGIYGDVPERCLDILESVGSKHLRAVFDPANFVQLGIKPFSEAFDMLKEHIEYLHIKDAVMGTGKVVPAGEGDGDISHIVEACINMGFENFLTLEPHLAVAGKFSGFSGPDRFRAAADALKVILTRLGVAIA